VARTGSDEFTVVTPDARPEELDQLGAHFRTAVLNSLVGDVGAAGIDASVGSAISGPDRNTYRDLMRAADQRMYLDKATHSSHRLPRPEPLEETGPMWRPSSSPSQSTPGRFDRFRWSNQPTQVRFTSLAWLLSGVAGAVAVHVPDAIPHKEPLFEAIVAATIVMAIARYFMRPATRLWQQVADVLVASAALALGIYATGGSASPIWPNALLVFIFIGWFVPLKWAPWTFIASMVILLAPVPFEDNQGGLILMDAVTIFGGIIVSCALLAILYHNHYYVERAQTLTKQLSSLDPRAGAYNRRAFEERMSEELDRLSYGDRDALAVVMVDLGNFKSVSANYGRSIGDQLLAEVADALSAASREEDCVARLGGDEFAIVAPGVDAESARALAERLVGAVREALETSSLPSNDEVRPSAGFALYGMHGRTTDELVTAADIALTAAKTASRDPNRVSSFVVAL
jgi:diguanylate cyclase (GGDEF)-like protein